ncbi:hypothetical protein V865_000418 [Kwoniella europaea PYCC6329]|uniref:Transcription factor spt8 beta-propeller domain-containing protein n=1 Tax=Kwoniella europaea PYCC6329 TaxID=1423913 RepID=A0AAX4K883_9TREE
MPNYDEDEEDEYYDNEEEEDEDGINGVNGDEDDNDNEEGMADGSDEDGSDVDEDAEENDNDEDDEDEEDDGDNEDDEEAEGEDNEDDDEEDDQNEEASTEDEAEGEGEAEGEDGDIVMDGGDEETRSVKKSRSPSLKPISEQNQPQPPHLIRRSLFIPSFSTPPKSLSIEAIAGIPLPSPVHSLASTSCLSYLLAGSQDGYVRAYDLWGSVNGGQMMTAQQRSVVGLGETINKAGVGRGWWANEVEGINNGSVGKRAEPVYSMACEGDGLFTLTGTQASFLVCHLELQLTCQLLTPSPRRQADEDQVDGDEDIMTKENISISMGPEFFDKKEKEDEQAAEDALPVDGADKSEINGDSTKEENGIANGDLEMSEAKSPSMDSLFGGDGDDDLDGEGETVPHSIVPSKAPTPLRDVTPTPPVVNKPKGPGLALPGQPKLPQPAVSEQPTPATSSTGAAPLFVPQSAGAGPSNSRQAAAHVPLLSHTSYKAFSDDVLLTSSMDGQVVLIDRRVPSNEGTGVGVGRLMPGERAPPWCMSACWSANGNQVLAGRRNGTIDIWDVRRSSSAKSPNLLTTLRTPAESGPISCLVAFPDGNHIATASQDNIRLWNTSEYFGQEESMNMKKRSSKPPFKIIAGHHGGTISSMIVDPTGRFLITASGDRGWQGESTKVVLIHEVKW